MKMMKRLAILSVFFLVLPQFVQAMTADQKRQAKRIERVITAVFKQFDQGKKSFAELEKIIAGKTKTLRGFNALVLAKKYEQMLEVKRQQQKQLPGMLQQQQEKERLDQLEKERLDQLEKDRLAKEQ